MNLKEIRERIKKATGGTWRVDNQRLSVVAPTPKDIWPDPVDIEYYGGFPVCEISRDNVDNAAFIAHARTDIPDLLQFIKEAKPVVEAFLFNHPHAMMAGQARAWMEKYGKENG